jgi:ribosomal protein L11 methyltransferase
MRSRPTNKALWAISVVTSPEAENAISEQLELILGQSTVSYIDLETGNATVTVYVEKAPHGKALRQSIAARLADIKACGLKVAPASISCRKVRQEDWAESWKRHFKPLEIGSTLLIKPSWSRRRPRRGQALVVIDPGLSFGTGQHPTTRFCLEQLVRLRASQSSFLDIGTGSGILAIAAAQLGYSPVHAFDFDPDAVRIARANAAENRILHRTRVFQADLTRMRDDSARRYDLVCANLISTLLIAEQKRILSRLGTNGVLIVAGILKTEFAQVQQAYERVGLKMIASRSEKEWRSGAFSYPRPKLRLRSH